MFKDFGITAPGAQKSAREALSRAGIISSRPNRTNIASEKVDRAREALEVAFLWHCGNGDCRRKAEASPSLLVDQAHCTICGGSKDRSSLTSMASALATANVSRVLVVGGTEAKTSGDTREVAARSRMAVRGRHEVEGRPLLPSQPSMGGNHRHLGAAPYSTTGCRRTSRARATTASSPSPVGASARLPMRSLST